MEKFMKFWGPLSPLLVLGLFFIGMAIAALAPKGESVSIEDGPLAAPGVYVGAGDVLRLPNGRFSPVEFSDHRRDIITVVEHFGDGICDEEAYSFEQIASGEVGLVRYGDANYQKAKDEAESPHCDFALIY